MSTSTSTSTSTNKIQNDPNAIIPQLANIDNTITFSDLETASRVLHAIGKLHPKHQKRKRKKTHAQQKNKKQNNNNNSDDDDNIEVKGDKKGEDKDSSTSTESDDNNKKEDYSDGLKLYQHINLRPLRKALALVFEIHKLQLYHGKSEEDHYVNRLQERSRTWLEHLKQGKKMADRVQQKKFIADTVLRRGRNEKLEKLKEEARDEEENKLRSFVKESQLAMMIPDGHVDTMSTDVKKMDVASNTNLLMLGNNLNEIGDSKQHQQQNDTTPKKILPKLRSCYVCKVRFRELHIFYDQLCPTCAKLNFEKRHFTTSLKNKIAIVTGSRVKIGYQTCLKLLRAGCTVVATTRFPNSAANTYRQEQDFDLWKDKLFIYGLDLRDIIGIEAFTRFLKIKFGHVGIDILINNACQTVRRPAAYYTPIVQKESEIWKDSDETHKGLLRGCLEFEDLRRQLLMDQILQHNSTTLSLQSAFYDSGDVDGKFAITGTRSTITDDSTSKTASTGTTTTTEAAAATLLTTETSSIPAPFKSTGLSHSASMSQITILPDDVGISPSVIPPGLSDINGQQLDLRTTNSWLLKLDQVTTPEIIECMFINAIAPFVLNSRLQPLMTTHAATASTTSASTSEEHPDRYVINVSAMEGKFYRYKMPNHPHTNMAKASLNMMTRTSSEELAKNHGIYMNSVDTGWINDENPLEKASKIAKTNYFQTPIDEIDAAARILDPIFVGVDIDHKFKNGDGGGVTKKKEKHYGKFFKDYKESEW